MIAFRLAFVVSVVGAAALFVIYLATGDRRWARWAVRVLLVGGGVILLYLVLFALERLLAH
ncbi:MAG: hypothetical protein N2557_03510 [Hydrogenophilus sp.]|nr:hypothetical protein [Hydrogenophilus sp.]